MNCSRAQTLLALYAGGDLEASQASILNEHLAVCPGCRNFLNDLEQNQSLLKTLRAEPVPAAALSEVRLAVFSSMTQQRSQPLLAMERWVLSSLRAPRLAVAGMVLLGVVSVTLLAQIGQRSIESAGAVPGFVEETVLRRPEGYRQWIYVGAAIGSVHAAQSEARVPSMIRSVYINPAGYQEYVKTGTFPEGTMMVAESAAMASKHEPGFEGWYEKEFVGLQVSVKDRRFEGGWGYYDFTAGPGELVAAARPEGSACISCHRDRAATDHVFTQFYPVLRAAARVL
jgi:hypothetical protein